MSRFLRFLLTAYAPLAARHMLVDGMPSWSAGRLAATRRTPRVVEFSACIDIGGRLRHSSTMSDDQASLVV